MGQAGLLQADALPRQHREKAVADDYLQRPANANTSTWHTEVRTHPNRRASVALS